MIGQIMKENAEESTSRVMMYEIFADGGSKEIRKYLISLKDRLKSQEE